MKTIRTALLCLACAALVAGMTAVVVVHGIPAEMEVREGE